MTEKTLREQNYKKNGKNDRWQQQRYNKQLKKYYTEKTEKKEEKIKEKKNCKWAKTSQSKCKKDVEKLDGNSIIWTTIMHLRDQNKELIENEKSLKHYVELYRKMNLINIKLIDDLKLENIRQERETLYYRIAFLIVTWCAFAFATLHFFY